MQLSSLQAQRRITLKNGRSMPLLGLGTCIGDLSDVERAVRHALKVGYRSAITSFMLLLHCWVGSLRSNSMFTIICAVVYLCPFFDMAIPSPQGNSKQKSAGPLKRLLKAWLQQLQTILPMPKE